MRLIQTSLVLVFSSLALMACSKSSDNGGGGVHTQSVDEKARGGQYNQAVIDDLKVAGSQSQPVLPDTSILTDQDANHADQRQAATNKLNPAGRAWLQTMQQNCSAQTTKTGNEGGEGHGESTTTLSGTACPVSVSSTQSHDTVVTRGPETKNPNGSKNPPPVIGGSITGHMTSTEQVIDQNLMQQSGVRQMTTSMNMAGQFSQFAIHMTADGGADVALVASNIRVDFQMDATQPMSQSQDSKPDHKIDGAHSAVPVGQAMAIAIKVTSTHGSSDFGIVMASDAVHYYMGGKEVSADDFNRALGGIVPQTTSAVRAFRAASLF